MQPHSRPLRPPVETWIAIQLGTLLAISALWLLAGLTAAYSALIGGLIYWLPNAWFARRAFKIQGAGAMRDVFAQIMSGEIAKLLLTAVLFAAAFIAVEPIHVAALFFTYCLMLFSHWFSSLVLEPKA